MDRKNKNQGTPYYLKCSPSGVTALQFKTRPKISFVCRAGEGLEDGKPALRRLSRDPSPSVRGAAGSKGWKSLRHQGTARPPPTWAAPPKLDAAKALQAGHPVRPFSRLLRTPRSAPLGRQLTAREPQRGWAPARSSPHGAWGWRWRLCPGRRPLGPRPPAGQASAAPGGASAPFKSQRGQRPARPAHGGRGERSGSRGPGRGLDKQAECPPPCFCLPGLPGGQVYCYFATTDGSKLSSTVLPFGIANRRLNPKPTSFHYSDPKLF